MFWRTNNTCVCNDINNLIDIEIMSQGKMSIHFYAQIKQCHKQIYFSVHLFSKPYFFSHLFYFFDEFPIYDDNIHLRKRKKKKKRRLSVSLFVLHFYSHPTVLRSANRRFLVLQKKKKSKERNRGWNGCMHF